MPTYSASHGNAWLRGQHVPIGRRLVDHARRGPVQADLVLTGSAVPDADCTLAPALEVAPDVPLLFGVGSRRRTAS
jgi:hypothetical protein